MESNEDSNQLKLRASHEDAIENQLAEPGENSSDQLANEDSDEEWSLAKLLEERVRRESSKNSITLELEASNEDGEVNPLQLQVASNGEVLSRAQVVENNIDLIKAVFGNTSEILVDYTRYVVHAKTAIEMYRGGSGLKIKDGVVNIKSSSFSTGSCDRSAAPFKTVEAQIELNSALTDEHVLNIHNELYGKFPILNSSLPVITSLESRYVKQSDLLLSRTYSSNPEIAKSSIKEITSKYMDGYPIFHDVLAIINLGIAKGDDYPNVPYVSHITLGNNNHYQLFAQMFSQEGIDPTLVIERSEPFRLIHSLNNSDLVNIDKPEAGGVYKIEYNVALYLEQAKYAMHELLHSAVSILLDNEAKPYNEESKASYEVAVKEFLLGLAAKLKIEADASEEDLSNIYYKLKDASILDLLSISVTPKFDLKTFFSSKSFFANEKVYDTLKFNRFSSKYFEGQDVEDITQEMILERLNIEIERIGLNSLEVEIISRISSLFFQYSWDQFEAELVASMADSYYEYGNAAEVKDLFAPVEKHWVETIHPLVEQTLVIPHQLECSGSLDTNIFKYCVEEFLS